MFLHIKFWSNSCICIFTSSINCTCSINFFEVQASEIYSFINRARCRNIDTTSQGYSTCKDCLTYASNVRLVDWSVQKKFNLKKYFSLYMILDKQFLQKHTIINQININVKQYYCHLILILNACFCRCHLICWAES